MSTTTDLGNDKIGPLLLKLAVPAILAQLVNALYNIVDRMYIGHIEGVGTDALTGVGVTFPIIMIISAFAALIGMGGSPRAAIKMGENKNSDAENIMGNCFVSLIVISVILTVIFTIWGRELLMMFGASVDTIEYGASYMQIYVIGTIFVQMSLGLNPFISTQGFAKYAMLTVLIGAISNIVLDPIFIFVFDLGVQGAAIATVISQAISAIWVMKFLSSSKSQLKIQAKYFKLQPKIILPVLALGLSPFIMQSTESLVNIALNSSLQRYGGDKAVGSMTIIGSVMQFCLMPLTGLAASAQPIVGYNFGAKKMDRVKKTFKYLIVSALIFSVSLWAVVMIYPQGFVRLFLRDESLMATTVWAMRIFMSGIFMLGAQFACQQTFVALGQSVTCLSLALLRKVVLLIPLVYILPIFIEDNVKAIFLSEPIADIIATTVTVSVFVLSFNKILAKRSNESNIDEPVIHNS